MSIFAFLGAASSGTAIVPSALMDFMTGVMPAGGTFTRASTAGRFNSSSSYTTMAIDAPRFNYDPISGTLLGLLMEAAAANSQRNSTMVGAVSGTPGTAPTGWTHNASASYTRTTTVGTALGLNSIKLRYVKTDGTAPTFGLYMDSTTGIPAVAGDVITYSVLIRLASGSMANTAGTRVDLLPRIAGGSSASSATLIGKNTLVNEIGSNFIVLSSGAQTIVNGAGTTAFVRPYLTTTDTTGNVDLEYEILGTMVEKNGVMIRTSFIPTTTAEVSRAAESLSYPITGAFGSTSGSLVIEFETDLTKTSTDQPVVTLSDGTADNLMSLGTSMTQKGLGRMVKATIQEVSSAQGSVIPGTITKMGVSWNNTTMTIAVNGRVSTHTITSMPTFTTLNVSAFNGHIRRMTAYAVDIDVGAATRRGTNVDVLIISGQSNADGFPLKTLFDADAFGLTTQRQTDIFMYYKPTIWINTGIGFTAGSYTVDGAWWKFGATHNPLHMITSMTVGNTPAQGPEVESLRRCGIETYLAALYAAAYAGRELRIIKIAAHSSSLYEDWRISAATAGYLWDYFKTYVYDPAIADIVAEGRTPNVIGMVWMQGEGDAGNTTYANAYTTSLQTFINRVNALSYPPARIVIGRIAAWYAGNSNGVTVRAAQASVAAANSPQCVMIDTDSYPMIAGTGGADIHYTPAGLKLYAQAAWDIIHAAM